MDVISRDRLPRHFVQATLDLHGERGSRWLEDLAITVTECERRFHVRATRVASDLSYGLVLWVDGADGPAVLKLAVPDKDLIAEARALTLYGGRAAVRLLSVWPERGALLLERVHPGSPLALVTDDRQAMEAIATFARELWLTLDDHSGLARVDDWVSGLSRLRRRFDGGTGPLPSRLVDGAERVFQTLLATSPQPRLIHGDLHYGNILAAERRAWLAIDPKGVIGEPAFDVGYLLANPSAHLLESTRPADRVLADRIAFLPDALGVDRERVVAYAFATSVLSAWWSLEDHGRGWERAVAVAELLEPKLSHG